MAKVICSFCGENVAKGVKKWRRDVNSAYLFMTTVEARLKEDMLHGSPFMDEYFNKAQNDGIQLSISSLHTMFNRILYSHHPHLSFVVRERNKGLIDSRIII